MCKWVRKLGILVIIQNKKKGRISRNQNELWTDRVDLNPKGQQRNSVGEGKGSGAVPRLRSDPGSGRAGIERSNKLNWQADGGHGTKLYRGNLSYPWMACRRLSGEYCLADPREIRMVYLVYRQDDLSTLAYPGNFRRSHRGNLCVPGENRVKSNLPCSLRGAMWFEKRER